MNSPEFGSILAERKIAHDALAMSPEYLYGKLDIDAFFEQLKAEAPQGASSKGPTYAKTSGSDGYTIRSDDGSGSNWNNGGGGSNWNNGSNNSGGWEPSNNDSGGSNLVVLGLFCLTLGKLLFDYGYKLVHRTQEPATQDFLNKVNDLKQMQVQKSEEVRLALKAEFLQAATRLAITGTVLFTLSYLLNPERLRAIFEGLAAVIRLLLAELGHALQDAPFGSLNFTN